MTEQDPTKAQPQQETTNTDRDGDAPGGVQYGVPVPSQESVEAAAKQYAEDLAWKTAHPHQPLIRAANPKVGGEV